MVILVTERWHSKASHDHQDDQFRKVHLEAVPRIGGLAVISGMLATTLAYREYMSGYAMAVLLCGLPAFMAGFQEDITKAVGPMMRLAATLLSGALAWSFIDVKVTATALPLVDWLLAVPAISLIFTAFAIAGVAHGLNLIDGFHGLSGVSALIMLALLAALAQQVGDPLIQNICMVGFSATLGFVIFNWPTGRLFLGDGGAYFVGYWIACAAVLLVVRNPGEVSPFAAALVCWLPTMEVVFSSLRRLGCAGRAITHADRAHLHHLIYHRLARRFFRGNRAAAQASVVFYYAPFWAVLSAAVLLDPKEHWPSVWALVALTLLYLWSYRRLARHAMTPERPLYIASRS